MGAVQEKQFKDLLGEVEEAKHIAEETGKSLSEAKANVERREQRIQELTTELKNNQAEFKTAAENYEDLKGLDADVKRRDQNIQELTTQFEKSQAEHKKAAENYDDLINPMSPVSPSIKSKRCSV